MSRARNIKPGFFSNEDLAEIDPIGRLLFIGLWTLADREGRLEDRPKRIKAEILPYDNCDVDSLLNDLQSYGFIKRYSAQGKKYMQIVTFSKHQNPHPNEKKSEIPPVEEADATIDNREMVESTREMVESTREMQLTTRADSLNPDSLNPDTLNIDSVDSDESTSDARKKSDNVPYQEIVERYHRICPSLRRVKELTAKRRTAIKARFLSLGKDLNKLDEFLQKVEQSDFLTGRNGKMNCKLGIDWIFKQENFVKILEGNYDNGKFGGDKRGLPGRADEPESIYARAFGG